MTKAELNAHWELPDETIGDSYTMTHKREREAFVKGWHKAVESCCEWLYDYNQQQAKRGAKVVLSIKDFTINVADFKKYMEE